MEITGVNECQVYPTRARLFKDGGSRRGFPLRRKHDETLTRRESLEPGGSLQSQIRVPDSREKLANAHETRAGVKSIMHGV